MENKAFSYIRMSHPRQLLGDSLRRQHDMAVAYAAENGLVLDSMKPDIGISGWTGANRLVGTLSDFLAKIGTPKVPSGSYLLVESLDRISRENVLEAQALFLSIINAGITIVTLSKTGERVYEREAMKTNPTDLIISLLEMVRANQESELKSQRLKNAWKTKRDKLADGVKMKAPCPSWLRRTEEGHEEIKAKADVVRSIFEDLANGVGKDRIARQLNANGTALLRETNSGKGWHASTILHLVKSKSALGVYQPCMIVYDKGKKRRVAVGEPREAHYPAITTEELYQRAVAAMAGRRNGGSLKGGGRKGTRLSNLFGDGLAACAECAGPMLFKRGTKGRSPSSYIRCGNAARKAGCENHTHFRYEPLEASLLQALVDLEVPDNAAPSNAVEVANELARKMRLVEANRTALANQVEAIDVMGAVPEIADRITKLRAESVALLKEIADLQGQLALANTGDDAERVSLIAELYGEMNAVSDGDAFVIRSRIAMALRGLVDFIEFDESGIVTASIFRGLKAYRFDRFGVLTAHVDMTANVQPWSGEIISPETGERVRISTNHERLRKVYTRGQAEREEQLDRIIRRGA